MDISLVIPLYNEEGSLSLLTDWIFQSLKHEKYKFEIIFVDDGSNDKSWQVINKLIKVNQNIKGLRFLKNYGKSQALQAGFTEASGKYIVTLDSDLQDSPEEIIKMISLLDEGYDLISGWKRKRFDSLVFKNIPSKIFNWAARRVSGIKLHDFNCGLKVYRKEVIKSIHLYGEMHRYIPLIAAQKGYNKIGEKIVKHQARKFGNTKFGTNRFLRGFIDLITLWFMNKFGKRPMYFFGLWGTILLITGLTFTIYIGIDKLYFDTRARLITNRPEFFIALTLMILGSQFFIAGFMAEIFLSKNRVRNQYTIVEKIPKNDN